MSGSFPTTELGPLSSPITNLCQQGGLRVRSPPASKRLDFAEVHEERGCEVTMTAVPAVGGTLFPSALSSAFGNLGELEAGAPVPVVRSVAGGIRSAVSGCSASSSVAGWSEHRPT